MYFRLNVSLIPPSLSLLFVLMDMPGRHEAYFRSKRIQVVTDPSKKTQFHFAADELLKIEESVKVNSTFLYARYDHSPESAVL